MNSKFRGMDGWLQHIGLRHPFRSAATSTSDNINQLCDPFAWISDLISSPDGLIIWGRPGVGKSAYRHILEQTLAGGLEPEQWFAVSLCHRELAALLPDPATAQSIDETRFAELLLATAHARLASHQPGGAPAALVPPTLPQRRGQGRSRSAPQETPAALLAQLWSLLERQGYAGCMILVDEIDDIRGARGYPTIQRDLVWPLLSAWYEQPAWRWRAFLPEALRPYFTGEHAISARVQQWTIAWRPEHLQQMIADRMLYHSDQRYETIGDLCDEELAPTVDADLIALSEGNPRAAILLGGMLFREHCQRLPIPLSIGRASWENVRAEWRRQAEHRLAEHAPSSAAQPPPGEQAAVEEYAPPVTAAQVAPAALRFDETGAIWVGAAEITKKLNKRRYTLLKLLYDNQGKVVTKDQLIEAGWPAPENDDAFVSDDMLRQQINHIRDILSPEVDYIESVSGRGYRLSVTGISTRKQRPALPRT